MPPQDTYDPSQSPMPTSPYGTQPLAPRPMQERVNELETQKPPEYHGLKKVFDTLAGATRIGTAIEQAGRFGTQGYYERLAQAKANAAQEAGNIRGTQAEELGNATADEREAQAEYNRAHAKAEANPQAKQGNTPEEQFMTDALHGGPNGTAKTDAQGNPYTYLSAHQAWKQAEQDARPDKAPRDMTAKPGTVNGAPAWGVQTDQGWIDPETRQPIHGFKPQPTFAETGLYEPVQVPTPGGGMAPAVFNRRNGQTTLIPPTNAPIPKPAQKEIDADLATARNIERLEGAQQQILNEVDARGERGVMGGGPYLNGPESMQFVSNHIAMTFGGVKGARVGRDLIEEHVKARDLGQDLEAISQHVLSGGVITRQQAGQMMETERSMVNAP